MEKIRVIDSHTAGEPTRLVVSGAPALGGGSLQERLQQLRERTDWLRTSLCLEPRSSEAAVGALLCEPDDAANDAAVIFFNNNGYLGMCGHIGVLGVDHEGADARNFMLCPGGEYDRSPCGTGLSAKLACLYADGLIKPGHVWRQAGILGGMFEGCVTLADGEIIPEITGEAFVTAETELVFSEGDPYRFGIC